MAEPQTIPPSLGDETGAAGRKPVRKPRARVREIQPADNLLRAERELLAS
jgi:hypothetical protein